MLLPVINVLLMIRGDRGWLAQGLVGTLPFSGSLKVIITKAKYQNVRIIDPHSKVVVKHLKVANFFRKGNISFWRVESKKMVPALDIL